MSRTVIEHVISNHGLWYRTRDGVQTYWLDINANAPQRMVLPRPELDVAIAIVEFVLHRLKRDLATAEREAAREAGQP